MVVRRKALGIPALVLLVALLLTGCGGGIEALKTPLPGASWGDTPEEVGEALKLPSVELAGDGENWATLTVENTEVYDIPVSKAVLSFNMAHLRDVLYPTPEQGGVYRLGQIACTFTDKVAVEKALTALLGDPVPGDLTGRILGEVGGEAHSQVWVSEETTETGLTDAQKAWQKDVNAGLRDMGMPDSMFAAEPAPLVRVYVSDKDPDTFIVSSAALMYAACADAEEGK